MRLTHIKNALALIIILFNSGLTNAQSGENKQVLTLKQAIDYAILNSSATKNAGLDEQIAKQKVREITGMGLPQLNGSAELQNFIQLPTNLIPGEFFGGQPGSFIPVQFGTKYNTTVGLSASQLVFDGSYIIGLQASREYQRLSQKNKKRTEIELVEQVSKAYYAVIVNRERAKVLDINYERLESTFKEIKAYLKEGFAEKIDADRLQVALGNLSIEREKVKKLLEVSEYLLKYQMGMPMSQAIELSETINESEAIVIESESGDFSKRIELDLLRTHKNLLELDVKRYKSGYLPSLVAFGSLSTQAQRNKLNLFDTDERWFAIGVVGIKLNIPIFDGFQKDAKIKQARFELEKNKNEIDNVNRGLDFQLKTNYITYKNAIQTLEAQKKNLELAQEIVKVSTIKLKEGVGTNLELTTAEADLRQTQINYFEALYNAMIAKIDLKKSQGTLY